jgi:hypothetical protein
MGSNYDSLSTSTLVEYAFARINAQRIHSGSDAVNARVSEFLETDSATKEVMGRIADSYGQTYALSERAFTIMRGVLRDWREGRLPEVNFRNALIAFLSVP